MATTPSKWIFLFSLPVLVASCADRKSPAAKELILSMELKKGDLISCGPSDSQLGSVNFPVTGSKEIQDDFNLGVKLLHSFEYDEAEKVFARVIAKDPRCAMAYWGVAMSNFHPLWTPPTEAELKKGAEAIRVARLLDKTEKEAEYIEAIGVFYKDWDQVEHKARALSFEKAMQDLRETYPEDKEAAIFYALALNAAADPGDKTYSKQKIAGEILKGLYKKAPEHPGLHHYLIHTYDAPELALQGLAAARKYASVAPASAHALHMPSHIFTRLGLWEDCIRSNLASVASAQCYAESAGLEGHWDEELHGLDYLVYAYLQRGDNLSAGKERQYLESIQKVEPVNFKVAYAFAAIPARYVLENKLWKEAAALELKGGNIDWEKYPWQKSIFHFARFLGAVRSNQITAARQEERQLEKLQAELVKMKDAYKAKQVEIQCKSAAAWIRWKEGKPEEAFSLMKEAAALEDATGKHPVTPGEVIPARELLADLLMEMEEPAAALEAYEASLEKAPNRFNGLYGAALAAERSGHTEKAKTYYKQLLKVADQVRSDRPEIKRAMNYLKP